MPSPMLPSIAARPASSHSLEYAPLRGMDKSMDSGQLARSSTLSQSTRTSLTEQTASRKSVVDAAFIEAVQQYRPDTGYRQALRSSLDITVVGPRSSLRKSLSPSDSLPALVPAGSLLGQSRAQSRAQTPSWTAVGEEGMQRARIKPDEGGGD
eukprot:1957485-Prymnesium_polylepis.2